MSLRLWGGGQLGKVLKMPTIHSHSFPAKFTAVTLSLESLIALVNSSFRFKLILYIYFVYVHNGRGHVGATFSPWKSEDNLQGLVLFLHRVVFGIIITLGTSAFIH